MASVTRFTGANKVLANLTKLQAFSPNEFGRALYQETEVELKEVKLSTPVDRGPLRASEHVEGPRREGRRIWTEIIAATDYALEVHEDLEAFHTVGEAKYIERPLKESAPYMAGRVAKRIDLNKAL